MVERRFRAGELVRASHAGYAIQDGCDRLAVVVVVFDDPDLQMRVVPSGVQCSGFRVFQGRFTPSYSEGAR